MQRERTQPQHTPEDAVLPGQFEHVAYAINPDVENSLASVQSIDVTSGWSAQNTVSRKVKSAHVEKKFVKAYLLHTVVTRAK